MSQYSQSNLSPLAIAAEAYRAAHHLVTVVPSVTGEPPSWDALQTLWSAQAAVRRAGGRRRFIAIHNQACRKAAIARARLQNAV